MTLSACRVLLRTLTRQTRRRVNTSMHSSVRHPCSTSTCASVLVHHATSSSRPPTTSYVFSFTITFIDSLSGPIRRKFKDTRMHGERWCASLGLYEVRGEAPEADDVFVSETLIFDAPVIVFNKITILMTHMLPFNAAQ